MIKTIVMTSLLLRSDPLVMSAAHIVGAMVLLPNKLALSSIRSRETNLRQAANPAHGFALQDLQHNFVLFLSPHLPQGSSVFLLTLSDDLRKLAANRSKSRT
jgi:hypothetical protein